MLENVSIVTLSPMSEVKDPPNSTLDPQLRSMLEIQEPDDKSFIYCGTCSHVITAAGERTEVNGSHAHNFTNPHGFSFNVGCFGNALGCDISGRPEAADTWFMGYFWRVANCAECHSHLGWYFVLGPASESGDAFYGLILDRIQEDK
jgi:hypothetical protein